MQKAKKACTNADRIGLEHAFINLYQTRKYYHVDSRSFRLHTLRMCMDIINSVYFPPKDL